MPLINVVVTQDAYDYAKQRINFAKKGLGNLITTLLLQEQTRQEMREVLRAQRQAVPSKDNGDKPGVRTD
jgi:hypothetical protein